MLSPPPRPARASAACVSAVVLLLALSARPALARTGGMLPAAINLGPTSAAHSGRDLLEKPAVGDNGAVIRAVPSCPANTKLYKGVSQTAPAVSATNAVKTELTWQDLINDGWDLPARPSSTNYKTGVTNVLNKSTFYSVMCDGRGKVSDDRTQCFVNKGDTAPAVDKLLGATHLRYNCTTGKLWVLSYVFTDRFLEQQFDNHFASTCPDDPAGGCNSGTGNKFIQMGAGTCAGQSSKCPAPSLPSASNPTGGLCCSDTWKVTDTATWVGWLGEANITLPAGGTTAITGLLVHTQAGTVSGMFDTTSNIQQDQANGICLDCSAPSSPPPPPEEPGCNPATLEIQAQESPDFCSAAESVLFNFTVTASNTTVPLVPTLDPSTCTGGFLPDTTVYQASCERNTTQVTLTLSQDLGNKCTPPPASVTATRSSKPVPVVTVTPPQGPAVCADAEWTTLDFAVSSDQAGAIRVLSVTPATCTPDATEVASGGSLQVNCTRPFTGPSFVVTLTAESGDSDCQGSGTANPTVTVNTRPMLNVTLQSGDEEFCETQEEATYSFKVEATHLEKGEQVALAIPGNCEFTTPANLIGSPSKHEYPGIAFDVEVNCKKDAGWPQGFAPDLTATAGETDCIDEDSDSAHPTVTPLPEVRVEIDEPIDDVCSDDQDGFTFTATVYNDNDSSDAKLTATAVWGVTGQPGTNCSVDPNADVTSGDKVMITCNTPSGNFSAGTFSLQVHATAGVTDCTDSSFGTATLTVNPKPTISITGPSTGQVCEDDQTLSVTYDITSSDNFHTDLTFNNLCTATPYKYVPAGEVVVKCDRGDSSWPEPFNTQVSATAGEVDCKSTTHSNTMFTINKKPKHSVEVNPVVGCAKGNSTTIDFSVRDLGINSTAWVSSLVTSQPAVDMICAVHTVDGNTYKVKCESTGTLPAGFNVTLTVESGAAGCTRAVSATSVVTLTGCCDGGGDTAFATIQPRPTDPVTNGNASCFGAAGQLWPDCSNRWGWRNQFSGPGTQEAVLIAGAADGCKNTNKVVGRMSVKCTDDGTTDSRVILGLPDNFGITPRDNHFYVGCKAWLSPTLKETKTVKRSPGCQPPSFSAPKDTLRINAATNAGTCGNEEMGRCGGQAGGIFQNPQLFNTAGAGMLVKGCTCSDVYWLVHQADGNWRYARNSNGQCSL